MKTIQMIRRMFRKKSPSVLVKIYAPIEDLWNNEPIDLMTQYALMLKKLGGKLPDVRNIQYHGVFPVLDADRQYTPELYADVMKDSKKAIKGSGGSDLANIDYCRVIEPGYDEIWLFGGPYFGFYESRMVGKNAYWLNAPPLEMNIKPVIVMGFNYCRGLKEMIHNYCHRTESVMAHLYKSNYVFMTYRGIWDEPKNGWDRWVYENGNAHNKRGCEPYSQDEFEWLKKFRWWSLV